MSKLPERLVARQLIDHLNTWNLMPTLQSVYRANHSTETAVLRVISDILGALDRVDLAALTLLDLSAAFDTVNHKTLIRHLETCYGIRCTVLDWLLTYLEQCTQHVRCRGHSPNPSLVLCGSLKNLSCDRSCLSSTSPTLLILLRKAACVHIFTLMTHRYMVSAVRTTPRLTEQSNRVHQRL